MRVSGRILRWFLLRVTVAFGVMVFCIYAFLSATPQGATTVKSVLFVTQVMPLVVKPMEWVTSDPIREVVHFPITNGQGEADVYRIPDGKKRAAILVFLGVNPAPRDDERVVDLGNGLARAGFVAMFPWSPTMMEKRISPEEPDNLVWAFKHLQGLDYVDPERGGMGGFCVGASIALVAASDPRISDDVDFVSAFGAYYDVGDLLIQIATNRSFYDGTAEPWEPRSLTEEVFTNQLIEGLDADRGEDRDLLTRIFIQKAPAVDQEIQELSLEGMAVYRLLRSLTARDEEQRLSLAKAEEYLQDLPAGLLRDFDKISPSTNIRNLKARLLIAHDREDDAVPVEESRRLVDSISGRGDFKYTEFSFFSHVTPDRPVGPVTFVKEAFKLFRYAYGIIDLTS